MKNFFEKMSAPMSSLNSYELKIQALAIFAIAIIMSFMVAFFISSIHPNIFLPVFLPMSSVGFFCSLCIFLWKHLEKNFNMASAINPNKPSFEAGIIILLFISFGIFVALCIFGFFAINIIIGFGFGIVFFYPSVFMFFRRKTCFNEKSRIISNKRNPIFGYPIMDYWILGIVYGLFTIGFGFFCLSRFLYLNTPPLVLCLLIIIFSFILVSLFLSPDLMNKILPFEIREKKGHHLYSALTIMVSFILLGIFTRIIETFFPL